MLQFQSNIAQNKKEIRKFIKNLRGELFKTGQIAQISDRIVEKNLNWSFYKDAKNVLLFYPLKEEINLLPLLDDKSKNFFFPKCDGIELLVCPNCNDFALNKYGIKEPKTKPLSDLSIIDIVFTPALCADKNFSRIGYGGGYYDRFFSKKNLRAKKIIVLNEDFLCEKLPKDEFDIKCDGIITQNSILF